MRQPSRTLALGLAAVLLATSCGDDTEGPSTADVGDDTATRPDRTTTEPREPEGAGMPSLVGEIDRAEPSPDAPVDELVAGLQSFTVDFARQAGDGDANLVFSPTSIGITFAMAHAGAYEATAAQIAEAFGFPDEGLDEAVNALTQRLIAANSEEVTIEPANSTWVQDGAAIGRPFLETMATFYGHGVEVTDFSGDAEASRGRINGWVAERTRDRIPELLGSGAVTPETVAVLVNAIYMKAAWNDPFALGATSDQRFFLPDGSWEWTPMMRNATLSARAHRGELDGVAYTAVELPYVGDELAMVVVVPDQGTPLRELEAGLDGAALGRITGALQPASVDLSLPRWDFASELDLDQAMSALGVPVPGGDLRGVAPGVIIDSAVHAANITVDEEGTEAAAATAVIGTTSAPAEVLTVTVDRPFLFWVHHIETGAPLFYGRLTNPR